MQAQSRFAMSGCSSLSSSVSADEHEAVVRELTLGHELTAQLEAEALRALRGQGQAEATAALILQKVSRAFTVCLSIMSSPARAPPPPLPEPSAGPRKRTVTPHPHFDGYQWRKYGQKKITGKKFPRSYYRCSYHRERNCKAAKQVQQHTADDPPQFVVIYVNEHTCDTPAWEPEAAAGAANPLLDLDLSGLRTRQHHGAGRALLDERGVMEERERQALVSSLACVLGGGHSPAGSGSCGAVAVAEEPPQQHGPDASASSWSAAAAAATSAFDAPDEPLHLAGVDDVGLDVMDYYCFDHSYDIPGEPF